jgi:hypothetical protein
MKNISRRDVKMFLFGILTMLLITLILDWDSTVQGFNDGLNGKPFKISNSK